MSNVPQLTFYVYRSRSPFRRGQWFWRARAANHRVVATSGEGYTNRADCWSALALIQNHAATAEAVEVEDPIR